MDDALKNCEDELARLKAENRDLRKSSEGFGELAERLNRALRQGEGPEIHEADREGRGGP